MALSVIRFYVNCTVAVWLSINIVAHINKVTLCRAGLILRWVTIHGYTTLVFNQATQANLACG